jgi:hypothetical protein
MQPIAVKTTEAYLKEWKFTFTDSGIANSKDIETIGNELDLFQTPSIIFNKNTAVFQHHCGFRIELNAYDGLKLINFK